MSPLPRFNSLPPERQDALLSAARNEIARAGFAGASLNRILEAIGLSKSSLYYYFEDREDLLRTALTDSLERLLAAMGPIGDVQSPEEYWLGWHRLYCRFLECQLEDPVLAAVNWRAIQARASGTGPKALAELGDVMFQWTEELLRLGQAVNAVRTDIPDRLMAHAAFGMLEGGDRWFAELWPTVSENSVEALAGHVVYALRRLVGTTQWTTPPTSNGGHQ